MISSFKLFFRTLKKESEKGNLHNANDFLRDRTWISDETWEKTRAAKWIWCYVLTSNWRHFFVHIATNLYATEVKVCARRQHERHQIETLVHCACCNDGRRAWCKPFSWCIRCCCSFYLLLIIYYCASAQCYIAHPHPHLFMVSLTLGDSSRPSEPERNMDSFNYYYYL